jgi:hypothetical protein
MATVVANSRAVNPEFFCIIIHLRCDMIQNLCQLVF